jgi:serine protease Do
VNHRHVSITAALAFAVALTLPASAAQRIPGRLQTAPLITQGPGSDIRITVRELRDDQRREDLHGVEVVDVVRGGPAQRAGLAAGDIITQFDREAVTSSAQFGRLVRDTPPDRIVVVVFVRMGVSREVKLTTAIARPQ